MFGIMGAAPNSGNRGVNALGISLLAGIARRVEDPNVTFFDFGSDIRSATTEINGRVIPYALCGMPPTRRIHRWHSFWMTRNSIRFGVVTHPVVRAIRNADAVIDVTGGDSFTDLYGSRRFRWAIDCKRFVLDCGRPLILAPQTIGPFRTDQARRQARDVLRRATMVWARDVDSHRAIEELLGPDFDGDIHRLGVDLAFELEPRAPEQALSEPVRRLLSATDRRSLIGFNVSSLVSRRPSQASKQFGLRLDYRKTVIGFLQRALAETDARVLLIPHVYTRPGHFEHDPDACASVADALGATFADRVFMLDTELDASESKWLIGQVGWFCGTRLHSTIAALSSGVPAASIAYSVKTRGVFETCGQADHVVDGTTTNTKDAIEQLWRSWSDRDQTALVLRRQMDTVRAQSTAQMDEMIAATRSIFDTKVRTRVAA